MGEPLGLLIIPGRHSQGSRPSRQRYKKCSFCSCKSGLPYYWICSQVARTVPALRGLLLRGVNILVPLAQLAQLTGALLGHPGSLGLVPQALVLQALLQLQDARLSSARH